LGAHLLWGERGFRDEVTAVSIDKYGAPAKATCKDVHLKKPFDDFWGHAGKHGNVWPEDEVRPLVLCIAVIYFFCIDRRKKIQHADWVCTKKLSELSSIDCVLIVFDCLVPVLVITLAREFFVGHSFADELFCHLCCSHWATFNSTHDVFCTVHCAGFFYTGVANKHDHKVGVITDGSKIHPEPTAG